MSLITDVRLPVVQLVRVSVGHRAAAGGGPALHEASVGFPERTLTAVVGPSGAGKSTLLRCASGLERPDRGKVFRGFRELDAMDDRELTELRGLFVPRRPELLPGLTVYRTVARAARATGRRSRRAAAMDALCQVGLEEAAGRSVDGLSAERRKRVAVAATLVAGPRILFIDEPTDSLDPAGARRVMDVLRALVERAGRTVVMGTSDPQAAARADRTVFLVAGRVAGKLDHPTADEVAAELARRQPTQADAMAP
ncbi:ATP-binding cassette domain-containing protein [Streptomyces indiaensis]|uniref:ABC transporter ATP-binding protein n=1 Tax=Streptomyces indiaensis TaxID=284033 RepID=A0ABP6HER0_9ACTN|nr:ATP-binding cassette domain-containing protein [Streptomyces indiaensis]MCF1649080.1 ATP-binding cassette domain-containing protein [Streptomyces indiaensis]